MINVTLWESSLIAIDHTALPNLQPLRSAHLREMSQHHKTWSTQSLNDYKKARKAGTAPIKPADYFWNLKQVGCSAIEMYATVILMKTCSDFSPPAVAAMKSCLTSRVTHAYLGYHLGLYQKLKGSALDAQESQRQSQDLAADAFEAYVGALCKQDLAKRWLKSVWSPNVLPGLKDLGRAAGPVIQTQQPQKAKEKVVKKKLAKQVQAVAIKSKGSQKAGGKKGQPAIGKKVKKGGNGGAQQTQKPADVKQTQQGKVDAVKREVVVKQER